MPNIVVHLPFDSYPGPCRQRLVQALNHAACSAEQIADNPASRSMCWVMVHELGQGQFTCGGADPTDGIVPSLVQVFVPLGVLDESSRARYAALIHRAFEDARPEGAGAMPMVSTVFFDVPDRHWGVNAQIWSLADFARAAGYLHMQG